MKNNNCIFIFILLFFSISIIALACGPDFDDAYFVRMTENEFLALPEGSFQFELSRLTGNTALMIEPEGQAGRVADADLDDLKSALKDQKIEGKEFDEAIASYKYLRDTITTFQESRKVYIDGWWYGGGFRNYERNTTCSCCEAEDTIINNLKDLTLHFNSNITKEFQLYLKGAVKYHCNDFDGAIKDWKKILKLSESERRYKTTWATYMIGMSYLSMRDQKKAISYFKRTRKLSEQGFPDPLHLASDSNGWQALAEFESGKPVASIKLYLKQMDVNSLSWVCRKISETKDGTIEEVVKVKTSRKVILGWAVSRASWDVTEEGEYKDFFGRLLTSIEELKIDSPVDYADRVAWLYYNKGDMEKTKQWLKLSKAATPLAQYIDYKLTLRNGNVELAIQKLTQIIPAFEQSQDTDIFFQDNIVEAMHSEMAILKLNRKDYLSAFELILKGKYWEDIAYIAERVLTIQELEKYLQTHRNSPELSDTRFGGYYTDEEKNKGNTLQQMLEYILARRIARKGEWDKALKYMPTQVISSYSSDNEKFNPKKELAELQDLLLKGRNKRFSNVERARTYYDAGMIMRKYGMELVGTELDPDGFVHWGMFPSEEILENRFAILTKEEKRYYASNDYLKDRLKDISIQREKMKKNPGFFQGSKEEEKRVLSSLPSPNKTFHYRYKAAELMWQGALLLPDNDELKAKLLCQGGTFIKTRDPQYADKFYKALVRTCPKTELGKEADKMRWFPILKN